MNERFTPAADRMMELAQKEAERLKHECVGTEHLLLALAILAQLRSCEDGRFVLEILSRVGIGPSTILHKVESLVPAGSESFSRGRLPQTPSVQRAIVCAYEEARNLQHNRVAPVHIFLAFMRKEMESCVAGHVLRSTINPSFTIEKIRQIVWGALSKPASELPPQFSTVSATSEPEGEAGEKPVAARNDVSCGVDDLRTVLGYSITRSQKTLQAPELFAAEFKDGIALGQAWAALAQAAAIALAAMAMESISVLAAEETKS